jgi:Flp pilus assembly pilin Flp
MRRRPLADRRESGASTLEYAAVIAMAAVLIVAVVGIARQAPIPQFITDAICRVSQAVGVGPCSDGPGGGDQGGNDNADVDIPEGLDPDSELVKLLLSTERGRQTLQWLSDNHIPIVVDPDATGAYWDGTQIVLGEDFDNGAVVVHEANHARYAVEGRHASATELGRDAYVAATVDEEVDGTVQQILAAKEFREAGHEIGQQPAEDAYDAAYAKALQAGQTVGEAERAGRRAVSAAFYNGAIVTSTTGQSYPDYYGDYWDSVN